MPLVAIYGYCVRPHFGASINSYIVNISVHNLLFTLLIMGFYSPHCTLKYLHLPRWVISIDKAVSSYRFALTKLFIFHNLVTNHLKRQTVHDVLCIIGDIGN